MNKPKRTETKAPRVLLFGAGRFGRNHLRVLLELHRERKAELVGVMVRTEASARALRATTPAPVFAHLSPELLSRVDAVIIVTPSETHDELVTQCLPFAHVFVEKPFASSPVAAQKHLALARRSGHRLMVGHIFRFHFLTRAVSRILARHAPVGVTGSFISPIATDRGEAAVFEEMHFFDLLDLWFGEKPRAVWSRERERVTEVSLRYRRFDALFEIGWDGERKERALRFEFGPRAPWKHLTADYVTSTLTYIGRDGVTRTLPVHGREPLKEELSAFIRYAQSGEKRPDFPDARVALRVLRVMERAVPHPSGRRPRVAVIGGGIFGMTAAIVLKRACKITVFERHPDILAEASYINQYRHHEGYHYPRSPKTIAQIKSTAHLFEQLYGDAIIRFPSFYAVAKRGSRTTPSAFRRVCRREGLRYTEAYPESDFLARESVSTCIKTAEAVYDYVRLKAIVRRKSRGVHLRLNAPVTGIELLPDGRKEVWYRTDGVRRAETFDYLVNATYANYNTVLGWLGFPKREMEYRFKELAVVEIRRPKPCAVTVVDGPFATLVPTGTAHVYTLGDVPLSVHKTSRRYSDRAFARFRRSASARAQKMLTRCAAWFPALSEARYLRSLFVTLPVPVDAREHDDRVTNLAYHGFGCFSVLEGKILTAAAFARELLNNIRALEISKRCGRV